MRKTCIRPLSCYFLLSLNSNAQKTKGCQSGKTDKPDRRQELPLKMWWIHFSILADTKEVDKEVLLFTENATVETVMNGPAGIHR
ncbi:MAG: hypothetical protein WDO19_03245 [Bacteroidota bacterium]